MSPAIRPIFVEDLQTLQRIATLYCSIWLEPPWNENFWKVEDVVVDLKSQLSRKNGSGFYALSSEEVQGFTWGYEVDQSELRTIVGSSSLDSLFNKYDRVFYVDELGVGSESRSQGLGRNLSQSLIASAKQCGCSAITLRTDVAAMAAKSLYERLGFENLNILDEKYPSRTYWILRL